MCSSSLSLFNSSFGWIGIVTYISLNMMHIVHLVPGLLSHVLNSTNFCRQNRALICFRYQKIKEKRPADIRLHVKMDASCVILTY